ncbi:SMP-30/gluconolactonase/LRE family protein [Rhizobium leguminosarum]|nr:SMP-30/gluconolactonase/LRE family protein [Rhizobium leguminosarum]
MNRARVRLEGRGLVECPRWHDGELWFADWTSGEILAFSEHGTVRVATAAKAPPLSFDFGPQGDMYVIASGASHLLRFNGSGLEEFAELGANGWNEIVIDPQGRIYVNGPAILLILQTGRSIHKRKAFSFRTEWLSLRTGAHWFAPKAGRNG